MDGTSAELRGILERNEAVGAAGEEGSGYYINHAEIELDLSEIAVPDEAAEGVPVSVEGSFETREHPESGSTRWVFKARTLRQDVPGGEAPPLSGSPPSV